METAANCAVFTERPNADVQFIKRAFDGIYRIALFYLSRGSTHGSADAKGVSLRFLASIRNAPVRCSGDFAL
jgi:hypothetical protein